MHRRRPGGECWGRKVSEFSGLPLQIICLAAGWLRCHQHLVVSAGPSTSRDRHSAYYISTPGLPRSACIPSRCLYRDNMERPLLSLRVERIPISLSALPSTTTAMLWLSTSSLNVPPLPIPLRREVSLLKPHFSLLRGENRLSEVSSKDLISTLSDPLQFLVKLQSEESAPAHAWSPLP